MDFYEVLDQVLDLLKQRGRASYRALKRQFELDDEYLEDLKLEIIRVKQLALGQHILRLGRFHETLPAA